MRQRSAIIHIVTKVGIFFAALFLVGVLLAAIPAHKQPTAEIAQPQEPASQSAGPASAAFPK